MFLQSNTITLYNCVFTEQHNNIVQLCFYRATLRFRCMTFPCLLYIYTQITPPFQWTRVLFCFLQVILLHYHFIPSILLRVIHTQYLGFSSLLIRVHYFSLLFIVTQFIICIRDCYGMLAVILVWDFYIIKKKTH